jgi:hypothetical protein
VYLLAELGFVDLIVACFTTTSKTSSSARPNLTYLIIRGGTCPSCGLSHPQRCRKIFPTCVTASANDYVVAPVAPSVVDNVAASVTAKGH